MKHLQTILLFSVLLLTSCQKNDMYRDRMIHVEIEKDFGIERVFDLAKKHGLSIVWINRFAYSSTIPADSLPYVKELLTSKPYFNKLPLDVLDTPTVYAYYNHGLKFDLIFYEINNVADQQDWLNTIKLLRLTNDYITGQSVDLNVPDGEEKKWCRILRKEEGVLLAERIRLTFLE